MKYTLYHIKGKKWGCTNNLKKRLKRQGYSIGDVYETETYNDIDTAADREKVLNLKYGYPWCDTQDYRKVVAKSRLGYQKAKHNPNFSSKESIDYARSCRVFGDGV